MILISSFLIDLIFGEPPNYLHLTVWIGKFIEKMENYFRKIKNEKLAGALLAISSIVLFTSFTFLIRLINIWWLEFILSVLILKMTFAFNSMFRHVIPIMKYMNTDIDLSRRFLSLVVRRDTKTLDKSHIASATIETIAEGFVDGFLSPIFYYVIFGLPGAVAYRVINTLDSMVGYKNERYIKFGWFSAKLDTLANYIPARIAFILFTISAFILRKNWRGSIITTIKFHSVTESKNAGWSMASMAGALNIWLRKPNEYYIEGGKEMPSLEKIKDALKIFTISAIITIIISSLLEVIL
ncbi:MAG: cobalamin biosynthesis protein [Candidatus Verstraetearchaeota archaeon]|nr:cobalamin biosynthesis protein [Candidatus Verstraetearchaeota archaeon]